MEFTVGKKNLLVILFYTSCKITLGIRLHPSDFPDAIFSDAQCRVLINEINVYTDDAQYIEISKYCMKPQRAPRPINMSKFRLLFINHRGFLFGVCKLTGTLKRRGVEKFWFFTIGNSSIQNIDFDQKNCQMSSYSVSEPNRLDFPLGTLYPVGLALVYHERVSTLDSLELRKDGSQFLKVKIDVGLEGLILRTLVDFYVYGSSTMYSYCKYFNKFYSGYDGIENAILRDWMGSNSVDLSLSRCGSSNTTILTIPFQKQLWLYTTKTPGAKNACKNGVSFEVGNSEPAAKRRKVLYIPGNPVGDECVIENESPANRGGFVSMPSDFQRELDNAISASAVENLDLEVPAIFREVALWGDRSDESAELGSNEDTVREHSEIIDVPHFINAIDDRPTTFTTKVVTVDQFDQELTPNVPYIWDSCEHFNRTNHQILTSLPGNPYNISDILAPDVCNWVELLENGKIRCKLCKSLLQQEIIFDRPKSSKITKIMTTGIGYLSGKNRRIENKQIILKHLNNPLHKISTYFFGKFDEGLRTASIVSNMQNEEGPYLSFYNQTRSMILAVYQAVQLGLPFYRFKMYTDTLKYFGASLGHLFNNEFGMSTITSAISEAMHKRMLEKMVTANQPLALILDEMTDVSTKSVVAILLQTLSEDQKVCIYLYKIIDMKANITGENIFNKLQQALAGDNVEAFFKRNVIAMATDGGTNFRGPFRRRLAEYIDNELMSTHCKCHVLERISFHAYKNLEYFKNVEKRTNEIFKIFNSRSPKRKQILNYMIIKYNDTNFEAKRIQKIRFVASKLKAIKNIILHFRPIRAALRNITLDDSFKENIRLLAAQVEEYLTDPIFLAVLAFTADVSEVLTTSSVNFQKRGFSPILMKQNREMLLSTFEQYDAEKMTYMSHLLSRMKLNDPTTNSLHNVTLEMIETELLIYEGVALSPPTNIVNYTLEGLFHSLIAELNIQIENYFPSGVEDHFSIFDPEGLDDMIENSDWRCNSLIALNAHLRWDHRNETLCVDWEELVEAIVRSPEFLNLKAIQPEVFWATYLDSSVTFTDIMVDVVSKVISTPATSIEAERIFSLYSATKTYRRYSLKVSTVEALLRIRFNGPKEMTEVDTDYLVKEFLKVHSRVDDESRREHWTPKLNLNEFSDEEIIGSSESAETSEGQDLFDDSEDE